MFSINKHNNKEAFGGEQKHKKNAAKSMISYFILYFKYF